MIKRINFPTNRILQPSDLEEMLDLVLENNGKLIKSMFGKNTKGLLDYGDSSISGDTINIPPFYGIGDKGVFTSRYSENQKNEKNHSKYLTQEDVVDDGHNDKVENGQVRQNNGSNSFFNHGARPHPSQCPSRVSQSGTSHRRRQTPVICSCAGTPVGLCSPHRCSLVHPNQERLECQRTSR